MSIPSFLIIFLSFIFLNIKASDSISKKTTNSKAAQQVVIQSKNSSQKDKQGLMIEQKQQKKTEEELFAEYQEKAQESRKNLKKVELQQKITLKEKEELKKLHSAIADNNTVLAKEFISKLSVFIINKFNEQGHTALMMAAQEGSIEIVKELIKKGVDLNLQDEDGAIALMLAVREKKLNIVRELLKNKANPNIQQKDGATVLMLAAYIGDLEAVKELIRGNADLEKKKQERIYSSYVCSSRKLFRYSYRAA